MGTLIEDAAEVATLATAIDTAIVAKGGTLVGGGKLRNAAAGIAAIPSGESWYNGWLDDGDTHLWIDCGCSIDNYFQIKCYRVSGSGNMSVDWGDGTSSTTTGALLTHTYSQSKKFRIDIVIDDGSVFCLAYNSSESSINLTGDYEKTQYASLYAKVKYFECGSGIYTDTPICKSLGLIKAKLNDSGGRYAFQDCIFLTDIDLGSSIEIRAYQHSNNYSLTNVNLTNITTLNSYSFNNCSLGADGNDVVIPEGVTSIPDRCFYNNYGLNFTWDLPSTIASIGSAAFLYAYTSNLKCRATTPPTIASNSLSSRFANIYVPSASVDAYKAATNWSVYASKISAIEE